MPGYTIDGVERVYEWIAATSDPVRVDALLVWLRAAANDPQLLANGVVVNQPRSRNALFADVPPAQTRVTYAVFDLPARCVHIVDISDSMFGAPAPVD